MEMSTEEIYAAFGLAAPATEPEPEQEEQKEPEAGGDAVGISAEDDSPEGESGEDAEPEDEETDGGDDDGEKKPEQTAEERKANAARRREAEKKAYADEAVRRALEEERREQNERLKKFFEKAGLKNTLTEKPITSLDEFDEWSDSFEREKIARDLKAGKLTPEALSAAVSDNPVVKKALAALEKSERDREAAERSAETAQIEAEIREIGKLDPTITSVADLLKAPYAEKFQEYVRRGNTFVDAYYLANREALEKTMAEKAREQAASNARSKEHLKTTGAARGSGDKPVPADVMALYRELNPGATEADIRAHYNKSHKA